MLFQYKSGLQIYPMGNILLVSSGTKTNIQQQFPGAKSDTYTKEVVGHITYFLIRIHDTEPVTFQVGE